MDSKLVKAKRKAEGRERTYFEPGKSAQVGAVLDADIGCSTSAWAIRVLRTFCYRRRRHCSTKLILLMGYLVSSVSPLDSRRISPPSIELALPGESRLFVSRLRNRVPKTRFVILNIRLSTEGDWGGCSWSWGSCRILKSPFFVVSSSGFRSRPAPYS